MSRLSKEDFVEMDEYDYESAMKEYVSRSQNLDVVILKGHLILEEQMERFISAYMKRPSEYFNNSPSFSQKLILCRALWSSDYPWDFVVKLNKLRNKLIHNLQENRETLVYEFIKDFYKEHSDPDYHHLIHKTMPKQKLLQHMKRSLYFMIGLLNGMTSGYLTSKNH